MKDSEGRTALMYSVMTNDKRLNMHLVSAYKVSRFEVNTVDNQNKSIAHHIVNPLPYGSYENAKLLNMLYTDVNLKTDMTDSHYKTPLDYALLQSSGVLAK